MGYNGNWDLLIFNGISCTGTGIYEQENNRKWKWIKIRAGQQLRRRDLCSESGTLGFSQNEHIS